LQKLQVMQSWPTSYTLPLQQRIGAYVEHWTSFKKYNDGVHRASAASPVELVVILRFKRLRIWKK